MKIFIIVISLLFFLWIPLPAQNTYKCGKTEYYIDKTYSNGQPKVKRSHKNKKEFLNSIGYDKTPEGYEIDHIIPLSHGGTDDPSNMQLLTKDEHRKKTAQERKQQKQQKKKAKIK